MARPAPFDRDRAIRILVDAISAGDEMACQRWGICRRTLARYRLRLASDPELSKAVKTTARELDAEWRTARRTFLRSAIAKLKELVDQAGVERIREVAGAIKIVGDLEVVSGAMGETGRDDDERRDPEPKPAAPVLQ